MFGPLFARLSKENPYRLNNQTFFGFEHCDPGFRNLEITEEQRDQFEQAWDFSIVEQLSWENAQITIDPSTFMGDPASIG